MDLAEEQLEVRANHPTGVPLYLVSWSITANSRQSPLIFHYAPEEFAILFGHGEQLSHQVYVLALILNDSDQDYTYGIDSAPEATDVS